MNYFAHALPHLGRPIYMAGTALPDWLSVANRKLRLRPRMLEPHLPSARGSAPVDDVCELAHGAWQHLQDDDWFHRSRGFAEVTAQLGLLFREHLQGSDGYRCGFLGHIVTEMLLDSVLIERYPQQLERYYAELADIDPLWVTATVAQLTGQSAEPLDWFIGIYQREQILRDYRDLERLWWRLNQVLQRVKLTPLPSSAVTWLVEMREIVAQRRLDLLPPEHYPWPEPQPRPQPESAP